MWPGLLTEVLRVVLFILEVGGNLRRRTHEDGVGHILVPAFPEVISAWPVGLHGPVFQKRKLRLREAYPFAQSLKDRKAEAWVHDPATGLRALLSAPSCLPQLQPACCHLPLLVIEGSGSTLGREGKGAPMCFRPWWPCKAAPHLGQNAGGWCQKFPCSLLNDVAEFISRSLSLQDSWVPSGQA